MEYDGITIYEDVSYKNKLLQYINEIIHDIFNDSKEVMVELEMIYDDNMFKLTLH